MHSAGLWGGRYYGNRAGSKISFDVSVLPCGLEEAKEGVPEYMTFGERNGFESHREQQLLGINIRLRIDFKHAPIEDARYMLVTCSAFVNYLISKYDKSKVECVRTI